MASENDNDETVPGLIEELPDLGASLNGSANGYHRRAGDNGAGFHYSGSDAARLFGRRAATQYASASPYARPRDASGRPQERKLIYDYPLPHFSSVKQSYDAALDLVRRHDPLRAALLQDMLSRIEAAEQRYHQLRREEEEKFQNYNEESRRADQWIDQKIAEIKIDRDDVADKYDRQLADLLDERARAREVASIARTAAGYSVNFAGFEDHDPASSATLPVPGNGPIRSDERAIRPKEPRPGLFQRLLPKPAAEPATSPVIVQPATSRHGDLMPTHVPFPLPEGYSRARSVAAIAVDSGLPVESPAAAMITRVTWLMSLWCLLACGFIFGISLGLLIGAIDPQMFSIRASKVLLPGLGFGILGVSMFWAIGRVISMYAALASEERHSAMLAMHRAGPDRVGRWLRWSAGTSLTVLLVATLVLVSIEATVERHGILAAFIDSANNAAIAAGNGHIAQHGPGGFAILCLVLTVSLPFVLFHAAEGWVSARHRCIRAYLEARRSSEAFEIANRLYDERLADVREAEQKADAARVEAAERESRTDLEELVDDAVARRLAPAIETGEENPDAPAPVEADSVTRRPLKVRDVDVALAVERSREANARVQELRKRKQDDLAFYDRRIEALEQQRRAERKEIDPTGYRRAEDAYNDYAGAVISFDGVYRREMERVERLIRPGIVVRLREFFFGPGKGR